MSVCIVHHLGLGDQLMLNGMARYLSKKVNTVYIVVKSCHNDTVEFMYRDCKNIVPVFVDSVSPQSVWGKVKELNCPPLPLATYDAPDDMWKFVTQGQGSDFSNWAHGVYIQAGVNPLYLTSKFKVERDPVREDNLYKKYNLENENNYIFVHDQGSGDDGPSINIQTDLKIIRPQLEDTNIFDYLKIIENAKEVHCINSVFAWMVELNKIGTPETNYFHTKLAHTYYSPKSVQTVFSDDIWTFV